MKFLSENASKPDGQSIRTEQEQLHPKSGDPERTRAHRLTHLLGQIRRGEAGYAQANKFLHENGGDRRE